MPTLRQLTHKEIGDAFDLARFGDRTFEWMGYIPDYALGPLGRHGSVFGHVIYREDTQYLMIHAATDPGGFWPLGDVLVFDTPGEARNVLRRAARSGIRYKRLGKQAFWRVK